MLREGAVLSHRQDDLRDWHGCLKLPLWRNADERVIVLLILSYEQCALLPDLRVPLGPLRYGKLAGRALFKSLERLRFSSLFPRLLSLITGINRE